MVVCNAYLQETRHEMQALILGLSTVPSETASAAAAAAAAGPEAEGMAQLALANLSQLMGAHRKALEKIKSPPSKALIKALQGIESRTK